MTTRRELLRLAAQTAADTVLAGHGGAAAARNQAHRTEVDLRKQESFNVVSLVEPVGRENDYPQSRIRSYRFQRWNGTSWITLIGGETSTPMTIHRIPRASSQRIRLLLKSSKELPHIAEIGVYDEPD